MMRPIRFKTTYHRSQFTAANTIFAVAFIVLMLDGLYITTDNYLLLSALRILLVLILGALIVIRFCYTFAGWGIKKECILFLFVHVFLLLYGLALSFIFGGGRYFSETNLHFYLLFSLAFGYAFINYLSEARRTVHKVVTSRLISVFFFGSLAYLFFSRAILFNPLPYFDFEAIDDELRFYSQATSALFGIASIYFLLVSFGKVFLWAFFLIITSLIFLYFSAIGGARGDFIIALALYCLILLRHKSVYSYLLLLSLTVLTSYIIFSEKYSENFLLLERFRDLIETGSFGERDVLLAQSLSLLSDHSFCIITGCGFNYFQHFFGYDYGMYPHNIVIEFLITYGAFISLPFFYLVVMGIRDFYGSQRVDGFFVYFIFFVFLTNLKSGSLISFMSIPVFLLFVFSPYISHYARQSTSHN
jgi:hypothetical protein